MLALFAAISSALLSSDAPTMLLLRPAPETNLDCPVLKWSPLASETLDAHAIVLIHGLDEPGDIWDTLGPALEREGRIVIRFDYRDDGEVACASKELIHALEDLRLRGVSRVTFIAHSMGGLVAMDALTRPDGYAQLLLAHPTLPDVVQLVTIATPFDGSPLAPWRAPLEIRDRAADLMRSPISMWRQLLTRDDGNGEAGADLTPGSEFLRRLQSRGVPKTLDFTAIVARVGDEASRKVGDLVGSDMVRGALTDARVDGWMRELAAGADSIGDGVVSMQSACAVECEDVIVVSATHRGAIRGLSFVEAGRAMTRCDTTDDPPAVRIIMDRLKH